MSKVKNKDQKLVVVSDIDGVVAEFVYNATALCKQIFGRPENPVLTVDMPTWGFHSLGITPEQEDIFWQHAAQTENYWFNQQEMYPGIVKKFADLVDSTTAVYWCTNKPHTKGSTAETQTALWLQKYGMANPCVVVSNDKGNFCKSVAADFFLDDKAGNVLDVIEKSPETLSFFLVHKYGEEYVEELQAKGAIPIYKTADFVECVKLKKEFGTIEQNSFCCK